MLFFQDGGGTFNGKEQFLSSSATLTVNVIDAQDTPPSFMGTPYFGYVYEVSSPVSTKKQPDFTFGLKFIVGSRKRMCISVTIIYFGSQ